jgi:hypothetical protein
MPGRLEKRWLDHSPLAGSEGAPGASGGAMWHMTSGMVLEPDRATDGGSKSAPRPARCADRS